MGLCREQCAELRKGTSAVLLQSGLDENWRAVSMECYCYLRNVTDLLSDGNTPYERLLGQPFKGPIIPFGVMVEYQTISAKTCRDGISSAQKSCQVYCLDMRYTW